MIKQQIVSISSRPIAYEYNDCTVLACSIVLQIPYEQMHKTFAEIGRQYCQGFRLDWLSEYLRNNGCILRGEFINIKLEELLSQIPVGRFLCVIKDHVFAVVNGVVIDYAEANPRKKIVRVYEHKPKDNPVNIKT